MVNKIESFLVVTYVILCVFTVLVPTPEINLSVDINIDYAPCIICIINPAKNKRKR